MNDLRWHPMPGDVKNHELPTDDGWRDYRYGRRQRVAFDLDRFERRIGAIPKRPQFNTATDTP